MKKSTPTQLKKASQFKSKPIKPKTKNQEYYFEALQGSTVTFCSGPAGCGKTAVAVGLACEYLLAGKIEKIVITRPVVEAGSGLGFLPGTLTEKIHPYLVPILEEMKKYFAKQSLNDMRVNNIIELCPLEYMRGRNFHNCFMILDEGQNATLSQIKMFITRIGQGSKALINGDLDQTDLPSSASGGMDYCMDRLDGCRGVTNVYLTEEDIVRNGIISRILKLL